MSEPACRLYRIMVWDPRTNYTSKTLGYIGETLRLPIERLMEHIAGQWWADTFAGCEVDDTVYSGKVAVQAAERRAVEDEKPLYNDEFNRSNRHRIDAVQQRLQRQERDRKRGVPTVTPVKIRAPKAAPRGAATAAPARRAKAPARPRQPEPALEAPSWLGRAAGSLLAWIVLAVALLWTRADWQGVEGARSAGIWSAAVVVGIAVLSRPKKRKRRRRPNG